MTPDKRANGQTYGGYFEGTWLRESKMSTLLACINGSY